MDIISLLIFALVQGATEFLPISSSAHLEIAHKLLGESEADLALDVAVHLGTLIAVILYFKNDVFKAWKGFLSLMRGQLHDPRIHLALSLIIATIPVCILGLLIKLLGLDQSLRSLSVMGWAMIVFGILLWWTERVSSPKKTANEWTMKEALWLGLWQALALIPGTSRSGITITGALSMGYKRREAARLAMLMSVPTIIASAALVSVDVIQDANWLLLQMSALAALFAFFAAYLALAVMMRLLETYSYTPYVIYRILLGTVLLWIAYR